MGNSICVVFCKSATIIKENSDNNGYMLVLQAKTDDEIYLFVNLYNSNGESVQLKSLYELETNLSKFEANEYNNLIF